MRSVRSALNIGTLAYCFRRSTCLLSPCSSLPHLSSLGPKASYSTLCGRSLHCCQDVSHLYEIRQPQITCGVIGISTTLPASRRWSRCDTNSYRWRGARLYRSFVYLRGGASSEAEAVSSASDNADGGSSSSSDTGESEREHQTAGTAALPQPSLPSSPSGAGHDGQANKGRWPFGVTEHDG